MLLRAAARANDGQAWLSMFVQPPTTNTHQSKQPKYDDDDDDDDWRQTAVHERN